MSRESSVESAALSTLAPLGNSLNQTGYDDAPGLTVTSMTVDESFLPLMKVPLLAGRNLQPGDTTASAVVISKRLAERMYGSLDVLGKSFPRRGEGQRANIVGVTAAANLIRIAASNMAEQYRPLEPASLASALLLVRMRSETLGPVRAAARRVNPAITPSLRWMRSDFDRRLQAPKLTSLVAASVGMLTMGLTAIGIFGLVAYTVTLRTREVGIRMALGAPAVSVLWLILRGLTWPVALGALAGAGLVVFGLAQVLAGQPLYADARDPWALLSGLAVLSLTGLAACLAPASRVLRINPTEALRE